jgi:hypothetical protein
VNAILFSKDGSTRTIENVSVSTYLDMPVYINPCDFVKWGQNELPDSMIGTFNRRRYLKQLESKDYAVFVEE